MYEASVETNSFFYAGAREVRGVYLIILHWQCNISDRIFATAAPTL